MMAVRDEWVNDHALPEEEPIDLDVLATAFAVATCERALEERRRELDPLEAKIALLGVRAEDLRMEIDQLLAMIEYGLRKQARAA